MLEPNLLVDRLVELLQATPEVVRLIGNRPDWIQGYRDSPPQSCSLSQAIFEMSAPGILVAWMGSSTPNELYAHNLSIYVRAADAAYPGAATYSQLVAAIINAKPTNQSQPLRNLELFPGLVEPMSVPSIQRIHDDDGTMDLFELNTTIPETFDNYGD
jgi:hypothetical protein